MEAKAKTRLEVATLLALLSVFGVALWWGLSNGEQAADGHAAAGVHPRPRPAARPASTGHAGVQNVELAALKQPQPEIESGDRDPFRFKAADPPPPQPGVPGGGGGPGNPGGGTAAGPGAPPGPPTVPPIPLHFIGVVDKTTHKQKVAVLTDGRGVFYGGEGDIIEGRYRILRIGVESIEMVYVDGRGAQTIRLSGS